MRLGALETLLRKYLSPDRLLDDVNHSNYLITFQTEHADIPGRAKSSEGDWPFRWRLWGTQVL